MYIASLSSSSTYGNAYLVWEDSKRPILIDCGVSLRRLTTSLKDLGMTPRDLACILITHEHADHVKAMCLKTPIGQRFGIPVYGSRGFWTWYEEYYPGHFDASLRKVVEPGQRIKLDGYGIQAFLKPHDARDPLGFIIEGESERAAFVMDLGHVPPGLISLLRGIERLVFESNHDVEMEKSSGRPWPLILRVLGANGHLSNVQAAQAISEIVTRDNKEVILAHLSLDCNTSELALETVKNVLSRKGLNCRISVAPACEMKVFHGG